ncbi:MAG: MarR family transcriptional regulator [Deltaproteobacteria bacterium]|nr:MarR family transcriptional regulator [Deltaproteobacteria bacterium]
MNKSPSNSPLSLSKKLLEILPPIVHKLRTIARTSVKGKVTLAQFRILAQINSGVKTVGEMAELQAVAQPTMSKMVDGLVRRGLVKRNFAVQDRRQIHLVLTKKGLSTYQHGRGAVEVYLSQEMRTLSEKERASLAEALIQIENVLVKREVPLLKIAT